MRTDNRFGQNIPFVPVRRKDTNRPDAGQEKLERLRESDVALRQVFSGVVAGKAKYPHNFSFKAMERICEEQERRQCRSRVAGYVAAAAVSVCAVVTLLFAIDFSAFPLPDFSSLLLPDFSVCGSAFSHDFFVANASVTVVIAFCFVFFVTLNKILSRHFYGRK
ncbi:MAG: hypothetical protein NC206_04705 [Bacteroides sp.]|nr:hypothetical protein [Roseburia sp.]MCM1346365.1 hypothetical protein [Bacteroides sp.]MCM1420400.1 hypothetical protein [Bacteroides sp.]